MKPRPVVPARLLPRPTYPTGLEPVGDGAVIDATAPTWYTTYEDGSGYFVNILARRTDADPPLQVPITERVTIAGRDMGLYRAASTDSTYGSSRGALWEEGLDAQCPRHRGG